MGTSGSKSSVHYEAFEAGLPALHGKVVAITGCTSGTGLVAAKCAARKGAARVLMLNRPSSRADEAERLVRAEAAVADGGPTSSTIVETVPCDLQDFASVRRCADAVAAKCAGGRLDVLCNNAGVMALEDRATVDGYDVQMQTNHLGHFLLTSLLMPSLKMGASKNGGPARVVNHSSMARSGGDLRQKYFGKNGGNLGGNGNSMIFGGARWERYHQTKLANYVMTSALADKLAGAGIDVISACAAPGLAETNLQVTTGHDGGMGSGMWIMRFAQSAEDGAMPLIHAMFGRDVGNGDFYEPRGGIKGLPAKYPLKAQALDESQKKLLWEASEEACGPFGL